MSRADMKFAVVLLSATGFAGCDKYLDRREQITFGSGDAVAFNKAAQIIDPWPATSRTVTHGMRGEQAEAAMIKLRRREGGEEPAGGSAPGGAPAGTQLSPAPAGGQPK
jgi:hypothetical protein